MTYLIENAFILEQNAKAQSALDEDFAALSRQLERRNLNADAIVAQVAAFGVALPSWGVGTGGTRFARFPGRG